jgi:hypothetical protein
MTNKQKVDADFAKRQNDLTAIDIFFNLIKTNQTITADNFVFECRKHEMSPLEISRTAGALFKSMKSNGYIRKTKEFKLSERTSKPLPIYQCVYKGPKQA